MADRSSSLVAAFRGPLLVAPLAVSLLATSLAALAQEPPSADEIVADLLAAGVHSHAFAELCQRDRDGALAALRSYLAAHHGERLAMDIRYAGRAVQECLGDGPAGEVAAHEFCAVLTRLGPEAATSWLDFIPNMCRKMPWGSAYRMRTATDDPELVPRLDLKLRATVPTVDELVSVEPATAVGYAARAGGWAMLAAAAREGRATCDIRQGRAAARDDIATALGMAPSSAPVLRLVARAETDLGAHLRPLDTRGCRVSPPSSRPLRARLCRRRLWHPCSSPAPRPAGRGARCRTCGRGGPRGGSAASRPRGPWHRSGRRRRLCSSRPLEHAGSPRALSSGSRRCRRGSMSPFGAGGSSTAPSGSYGRLTSTSRHASRRWPGATRSRRVGASSETHTPSGHPPKHGGRPRRGSLRC